MHTFDKILSFMLKPWVIITFLLLIIISFMYIDTPLALYVNSLDLRKNTPVLTWITFLGAARIYLIAIPILALVATYIFNKKILGLKIWMLWIIQLYPAVVTFVLKNFIGRARPFVYFDDKTFGFFGWTSYSEFHSFPSGHTTSMTTLMMGFIILFPKYRVFVSVMGFLVILSRVLLTFHYLSDVLATFYLVMLELGLLMYVVRRKYPKICELVANEKVN
ncbi:MAG: phosphatase PAP2 family protein [Legionellaceae bacterium]|nr:phosphatase PAP2 family protein [Legionellaceae bacterium]